MLDEKLTDSELLLRTADDLMNLRLGQENNCGDILLNHTKGLSAEKYNDITLLLAMCINRELSLRLTKNQDKKVPFEGFIKGLDTIAGDVLYRYHEVNEILVKSLQLNGGTSEDKLHFLRYLNELTARIAGIIPFKNKELDKVSKTEAGEPYEGSYLGYFTAWDIIDSRQALLHNRMRELLPLSKPNGEADAIKETELVNFTEKYRIDLPFMYVTAWILSRFCIRRPTDNASESDLLPVLRSCTPFLSQQAKEILCEGSLQMDRETALDLGELLPTIQIAGEILVPNRDLYRLRSAPKEKSYLFLTNLATIPLPERQRLVRTVLSRLPLIPCIIDEVKFDKRRLFRTTQDLLLYETELQKKNITLQQANVELEKRDQEKGMMLGVYSHNWRHISYPTIVKDVADALLAKSNDGEFVTLANKLRRAYNSEQNLRRGIELLQHLTSSDKLAVRKQFRNGIIISGVEKSQTITGIRELFDSSLDMVILRLVMEDVDQSANMTNRRSKIPNLGSLREDYVNRFLGRSTQGDTSQGKGESHDFKNTSLLEWVKTHLLDLSVELSDEWEAVRVNSDSFAAAQITSIFVELLTNILLHGANQARVNLTTSDETLDIQAENACPIGAEMSTNGDGITMLSKVVDKINYGNKTIKKSVWYNLTGVTYSIRIKLDKKLMYKPDNL